MSNPAQKQQLSKNLTNVIRGAVADGNQISGQGLPCSVVSVQGAIVTVAFDVTSDFTLPQVTCPVSESIYVILPIQVGDKGYVTSANARLGGVSGLGAGLAPLVNPSNLGGLVFVPVGSKAWTQVDQNSVQVQGPNGAIIQTMDGTARVTINETKIEADWSGNTVIINTSQIALNWHGKTVVIDSSGITLTATENTVQGDLTVNGDTVMNGALTLNGNFVTTGSTFTVNAPTMAITSAVAITGSLSVNGKDFTTHEHAAQGTLRAGSTVITGNTGTLI